MRNWLAVCRHLIKPKNIRITDLTEEFLRVKLEPKATYNLNKRHGHYDLLIINEWMLDNISDEFRAFLLEIFELRYKKYSTILCTKSNIKD